MGWLGRRILECGAGKDRRSLSTSGCWFKQDLPVLDHIFCRQTSYRGVANMLETIAVILIILWILGLVTSTTMGGFIHILLVIAVVVILIRLIR
jgi:hypothetical protein